MSNNKRNVTAPLNLAVNVVNTVQLAEIKQSLEKERLANEKHRQEELKAMRTENERRKVLDAEQLRHNREVEDRLQEEEQQNKRAREEQSKHLQHEKVTRQLKDIVDLKLDVRVEDMDFIEDLAIKRSSSIQEAAQSFQKRIHDAGFVFYSPAIDILEAFKQFCQGMSLEAEDEDYRHLFREKIKDIQDQKYDLQMFRAQMEAIHSARQEARDLEIFWQEFEASVPEREALLKNEFRLLLTEERMTTERFRYVPKQVNPKHFFCWDLSKMSKGDFAKIAGASGLFVPTWWLLRNDQLLLGLLTLFGAGLLFLVFYHELCVTKFSKTGGFINWDWIPENLTEAVRLKIAKNVRTSFSRGPDFLMVSFAEIFRADSSTLCAFLKDTSAPGFALTLQILSKKVPSYFTKAKLDQLLSVGDQNAYVRELTVAQHLSWELLRIAPDLEKNRALAVLSLCEIYSAPSYGPDSDGDWREIQSTPSCVLDSVGKVAKQFGRQGLARIASMDIDTVSQSLVIGIITENVGPQEALDLRIFWGKGSQLHTRKLVEDYFYATQKGKAAS